MKILKEYVVMLINLLEKDLRIKSMEALTTKLAITTHPTTMTPFNQ